MDYSVFYPVCVIDKRTGDLLRGRLVDVLRLSAMFVGRIPHLLLGRLDGLIVLVRS